MVWNVYGIGILVAVIGVYLLDVYASRLNLSRLGEPIPSSLRGVFGQEEYARSQAYTRATARFGIVHDTFSLALLLGFWWIGGFGWLDRWVRQFSDSSIVQGLCYVGVLYLGSTLVQLPFSWYDTFILEQRFSFNRTTPATFYGDRFKEMGLTLGLMTPLLAFVLWAFETLGPHAWWVGWASFVAFTLLVTYAAPQWILPLFFRFDPLPDGELKQAICRMADRCGFPVREVFQIDGSKRSTKTNAFFTGLGKHKRIALFDTLIQKHSTDELVAVLAHEIGHYRRRHILKGMIVGFAEAGLLFFLAGLFLKHRGIAEAFGVQDVSVYSSLVFFSILFTPASRMLGLLTLAMQRRHEFEADEFAAKVTGDSAALIRGLQKLAQENLTNLTPHPLYVFLNYSHPPIPERLAALESMPTPSL